MRSVLFISSEHLETFQNFLNGLLVNMLFKIKIEKQNRMSFLDVQIVRENKIFTTSGYCKTTFSRACTHCAFFIIPLYVWHCLHTCL